MSEEKDLSHALQIARIAMLFGEQMRATRHPDWRLESDATHTIMLAMLVGDLAAAEGLSVSTCISFAIVHDLAETYAGDVNTMEHTGGHVIADKQAREAAAVERLASELGESSWAVQWLRRYERQDEVESRFVRFVDKILPKLTHILNGGVCYDDIGLTPDDAEARHMSQGEKFKAMNKSLDATPRLFDDACNTCVAVFRDRISQPSPR